MGNIRRLSPIQRQGQFQQAAQRITPGFNQPILQPAPNPQLTGGKLPAGMTTPPIASPEALAQMGISPTVSGPTGQFPTQQIAQQPIQQPAAVQPQFGLAGGEQAFQAGALGGAGALQTGAQQGLGTLLAGFEQGQQQLGQGIEALQGAGGNVPFDPSLIQQGISALGGQFASPAQQAGSVGATAQQVDPVTGQPLFREGAAGIQQFTPLGLQAQQQQAALSGVLGQEAFDRAFNDNPAFNFLLQQGVDARTAAAAATGGVGGGELQKELTRFGQGLGAQNLQQQIQNANLLSGQGLQAATAGGQLLGQAGAQQGQLAGLNAQLGTQANLATAEAANRAALQNAQLGTQAGISEANRQAQLAGQQAQLFGQGAGLQQQAGLSNAQRALQAAQGQAGLFGQGAGLAGALAGQGAGIQAGTGQNIAQLLSGAGQQIGGARVQAGRDIAGQIGGASAGLADLIASQGAGISDITGAGAANLSNLLSGAGQLTAAQQTQLATILANLATQSGTQQAGFEQQAGVAQAEGTLGQAAGARSGLARLGALASGINFGAAPTSAISGSTFASQNLGNVAPFTFGSP